MIKSWLQPWKHTHEANRGAAVGIWPERMDAAWNLFAGQLPEDAKSLSVGDYGCGRQELRLKMPAEWDYTPYDHQMRSVDTVVCDFDNQLPEMRHDVIFCLGVLEYVRQPGRLLAHALRQGRWVVFSNFEGWNPWRAWKQGWRGRLTGDEREQIFEEERVLIKAHRPWRKDGGIWVCHGGRSAE